MQTVVPYLYETARILGQIQSICHLGFWISDSSIIIMQSESMMRPTDNNTQHSIHLAIVYF